jgi:hypothetical protein
MGPFLDILIFQKNRENFERWVELELVSTAPALQSSNTDTRLEVVSNNRRYISCGTGLRRKRHSVIRSIIIGEGGKVSYPILIR